MKRLLRVLSVMFVLISISAFADSVSFTNLNATLTIFANDGSGDNLGGQIWGSGISLGAEGGTEYSWFNDISGYAPGSTGGGGVMIFFENIFGKIGSRSYGPDDIEFDPCSSTTVLSYFQEATKKTSPSHFPPL